LPHAHHQYDLPDLTSTEKGSFCATTGEDIWTSIVFDWFLSAIGIVNLRRQGMTVDKHPWPSKTAQNEYERASNFLSPLLRHKDPQSGLSRATEAK
jgi:hypothetical protein